MKAEPSESARWRLVIEQMLEQLRSGEPRAEVYWAQQLAFGPVFIFAVLLAVRDRAIKPEDQELLRRLLPHALSLLGALPDDCDGDPHSLFLLARRQAQVLAWGRRHYLRRLGVRLGLELPSLPSEPVPSWLRRPYELIGWCPPDLARPSVETRDAPLTVPRVSAAAPR